MSKSNDSMIFFKHLILPTLASYLFLNLIFEYTSYFDLIFLIALSLLLAIVLPVRGYIKKGTINCRLSIYHLLINTALVVMLITSVCTITFTKDYNLKYTYWIALISLGLIVYIYFLPHLINAYKEGKLKAKHGKLSVIFTASLALIFPYLEGYDLIKPYLHPQREIVLENINTPKKITFSKFGQDVGEAYPETYEITSPDDINKIIGDLKSLRIKNISFTDLINYKRNERSNRPSYFVFFHYDSTDVNPKKIESGYISHMIVTSNRSIAIEERVSRHRFMRLDEHYSEVYPVSFSDGTMNMLFGYLK